MEELSTEQNAYRNLYRAMTLRLYATGYESFMPEFWCIRARRRMVG